MNPLDAFRAQLTRCESPIERQLLTALWSKLPAAAELRAQVQIGPCRVDFTMEQGDRRLAIECDGAAYHTAPLDRARDAARDYYLVVRGYEAVRLAGAEIVRDPAEAAGRVMRRWREGKRARRMKR